MVRGDANHGQIQRRQVINSILKIKNLSCDLHFELGCRTKLSKSNQNFTSEGMHTE
jgi:hypothetical protein